MVSINSYADIKDKYYDQAQEKTGVISGIIMILNDFVRKFDSRTNTMIGERSKVAQNYVEGSDWYLQKNKEINDSFTNDIKVIREEASTKIQEKVQGIKDKIAEIIGASMPDGAMNDVTVIKSFSGVLSDAEVKVFLEKYKKNYLVTKSIFGAMSEGQDKRLGVNFISADNVIGSLDSIEKTALKMVKAYNGGISYDVAVLLDGAWIQEVNDAFEAFVSVYAE